MADVLLSVDGLMTEFKLRTRSIAAVNNVSFEMYRGEVLGVVGESGCGKTQLAMSIMGLVPKPAGQITGGKVVLDGQDLRSLDEEGMRKVRGNLVSLVFQEPMTALNPVMTVGDQIGEALELHREMTRTEIRETVARLLGEVGIPDPEKRLDNYPFQLSGGLRQRVVIAMALACDPALLIADEPTTALDVTVQAQILRLFQRIKQERNQSILFITHDLSVLAAFADRIMVMYAGEVVELAPTQELLTNPRHPYTKGLLASVPQAEIMEAFGGGRQRLNPIPGTVQSRTVGEMQGCPFASRCPSVMSHCATVDPPTISPAEGQLVRCHLYSETKED